MARPQKEGMDYFPHDVDAVNDEKIEALRSLYGNDGYAFYFILLERIYRTKHFELDISDAETIQILSRKIGISADMFNKMLLTSIKHGAFCRDEYEERKVLTSNGIKKRASVVLSKREAMKDRYTTKVSGIVSAAETPQKTEEETPQSKDKVKIKENKNILITDGNGTSKGQPTDSIGKVSLCQCSEVKKKQKAVLSAEVESFFEKCWSMLPNKKGKGRVSKESKIKAFKMGDAFIDCINAFSRDMKSRDEQYIQHGSTFFNSGYLDYIKTVEQKAPVKELIWVNRSDVDAQ